MAPGADRFWLSHLAPPEAPAEPWQPTLPGDISQYRTIRRAYQQQQQQQREEETQASAYAMAPAVPRIALGTEVRLDKEHVAEIKQYAMERFSKNRKAGVTDRTYAPGRSGTDKDIQGCFGEASLARLFGTATRATLSDTSLRSGKTEVKFDGTLRPENWRVDVKTSRADTGYLRVQECKTSNPPDVFCLFVYVNYKYDVPLDSPDLEEPVLRFDGFIPAGDVFVEEHRRRDKTGVYYMVPSSKLRIREALYGVLPWKTLTERPV